MKKFRKIFIFLLLILILTLYFIKNYTAIYNIFSTNIVENFSHYKIIKKDTNPDYSGIGQEKVKNNNGYFTTFTTISENQKIYKEYKQNGNSSWSNNDYWNGTMAENGCGITALAIILSGYNKNYTPEDLRKKYYPVLNYSTISQELSSTYNIKNSDFYYDSIHLSNEKILSHLLTNKPILICVWSDEKENRWTKTSHYMVLLAATYNNLVYVSNPNGLQNDSKSSGWYDIDEITPYLAKALYIEE